MLKKKPAVFVRKLITIYYTKHVSRSAAELSYFLTLSVFPMLICLYSMLNSFLLNANVVVELAKGIIPEETMSIFSDYIGYISSHTSSAMLTAGFLAMATSSAAAFRSLHNIMGDIQGQSRFTGYFSVFFSLLFSLIFLAVIYFSVVVVITGNWFISFVSTNIPILSGVQSWVWVRFILLFMILLVIVYGIYRITAPRGTERSIATGAVIATVLLVAVSMLFSWFIGISSKYPLIYGSLASIFVLMFWLYVCGIILIMGNAVNVVIRDMKKSSESNPPIGAIKYK